MRRDRRGLHPGYCHRARYLAATVAANTFDRGTYVADGTQVSVSLIGGAARAASGSTLHILPGTPADKAGLKANSRLPSKKDTI